MQHLFRATKAACSLYVPYNGASCTFSKRTSDLIQQEGRRVRDCMIVGFATACGISDYHHKSYEFESISCRDVLDTTLCDKVCH